MNDVVSWIFFIVLIFIPFLCEIKNIGERFKDAWEGIAGLKYVPISLTVLFSTAFPFYFLAEVLPFLQWGLWGFNIATLMVMESEGTNVLFVILSILFLGLLMLVFNYYEEDTWSRENNWNVLIWALLHLVMGIPIWAVFPIMATGFVYRQVFLKKSQEEAYVSHLFTNVSLLVVIMILMLMTAP